MHLNYTGVLKVPVYMLIRHTYTHTHTTHTHTHTHRWRFILLSTSMYTPLAS
jgi:hypothetical protein